MRRFEHILGRLSIFLSTTINTGGTTTTINNNHTHGEGIRVFMPSFVADQFDANQDPQI